MKEVFVTILEAIIAFVATNVDDFMILLLFFAQTNPKFRPYHVVSGAYWGFAALVLVSLVGFLGGLIVSPEWIGLLGFLPILLGLKQLSQGNEADGQLQDVLQTEPVASQAHPWLAGLAALLHPQVYQVGVVTFANGGDNIGIYVPLFAASDVISLMVILIVFLVLRCLWCYGAYRLTQQHRIACVLTAYCHSASPFLLIGLGLFVLWKNNTLGWLIELSLS
jgi:cadmium resistance protein CadD (predicted permease)